MVDGMDTSHAWSRHGPLSRIEAWLATHRLWRRVHGRMGVKDLGSMHMNVRGDVLGGSSMRRPRHCAHNRS